MSVSARLTLNVVKQVTAQLRTQAEQAADANGRVDVARLPTETQAAVRALSNNGHVALKDLVAQIDRAQTAFEKADRSFLVHSFQQQKSAAVRGDGTLQPTELAWAKRNGGPLATKIAGMTENHANTLQPIQAFIERAGSILKQAEGPFPFVRNARGLLKPQQKERYQPYVPQTETLVHCFFQSQAWTSEALKRGAGMDGAQDKVTEKMQDAALAALEVAHVFTPEPEQLRTAATWAIAQVANQLVNYRPDPQAVHQDRFSGVTGDSAAVLMKTLEQADPSQRRAMLSSLTNSGWDSANQTMRLDPAWRSLALSGLGVGHGASD